MRLFDFLDYQKQINADLPFLISESRTLTYAEAADESVRVANLLLDSGISAGDRVAILSKNSIEYLILYYACSRIGAVTVPLNFRLSEREWTHILNDSHTKMLCIADEFAANANNMMADLSSTESILTLESNQEISGTVTRAYSQIENYADVAHENTVRKISVDIHPESPLYQMYTSGTTGVPKGVVVSHQNVSTTLHQLSLNTPYLNTGGNWSLVLPIFHAAAALHAFSGVSSGATLFVEKEFNPVKFAESLQNDRIRIALTVPDMIAALLAYVPNLKDYDFSALELFVYGASPITKSVLTQGMEVFACDFCQGYGMTEATLAITMLRPDDHRRAIESDPKLLESAGRPVLGTDITIRDPDNNVLAQGEVGEICVRGPQVMAKYWNLDDATREAMRGGWLHTGDAGYIDAEGYLFIVDRIKDMIISGGENIYPKEIELCLLQHPSVSAVSVIGVEDEKWGEVPKACIVLAPDAELDKEALDAFCRSNIATYKCPKHYLALDAIPTNAMGKVLKKELRKLVKEGAQDYSAA